MPITNSTRTLISDCPDKIGKEVVLKGFVRVIRSHGKLVFLDLRDRSGAVQVVVNQQISEKAYKESLGLRPEFAIELIGLVKERPKTAAAKESSTGAVEIEAKDIKILSKAEVLPFDMGGPNLNLELPTLLDYRALTLRHPKIAAIFKIQETIASSFRSALKEEGFTEIFVPSIVPTATEGGAEVFSVNYYSRNAYLAQSPQLYKQIMVGVFEKVFTVAHAYRAEPSITTRHLSEYVSLDVEFGFINSWEDLMNAAEKLITSILKNVREENKNEISTLGINEIPQIKKAIPRVKLVDAQELIFKRTGMDNRNAPDLNPSDEKELCVWAKEETGAPFVFVTHFPTKKRPFYTMPDPSDQESTLSFDLLGISEEWVTGGQRINNYEQLLTHIKKWGNKKENFEIYLQAFRYGMPPEGGFALGLERVTKDILGLANVREASLFPRDMERIDERLSVINKKDKKTS
ncbi:MAG: aspartate--tRNA(Asn) ligase [Candidatus Levybacteria bacterium]|nr:aspartate--tRNA(Asn) ligase [Candidatus Levybacteria bacterium]